MSKEPDAGSAEAAKSGLMYPAPVNNFYKLVNQSPYWYNPSRQAIRQHFVEVLDNAQYMGLNRDKYHYQDLKSNLAPATTDSTMLTRLDKVFTDAIFAYEKDVLEGADLSNWISNDEVSEKYAASYNTFLLSKLTSIKSPADLDVAFNALEPKETEYQTLKDELKTQLDAGNKLKAAEVRVSMNYFRWIHYFKFDKFIVVNIPSSTLHYYEKDNMQLAMKVVVGKPASRTPRMSTFLYEVILYPYWNVPDDIALNELFPKFKRNPDQMDKMNMQLVDYRGKVVDRSEVDWSAYDRNSFPFGFRQNTGCDNALGVIKFNLTDPFVVYMHDTNYKLAFQSDTRYMSHGCIRVEKPVDLANSLLENQIDTPFIKACIEGQNPQTMKLKKVVPVFVVYMPAEVQDDGQVKYFKDIYRLFK
jgi:L,D-transpeptidase YcbB